DFALEGIAYQRVGHVVVFADAEVEKFAVGMDGEGCPLGPLDLLKLVDLGVLAVVGAADAVGKQRLKPGVRGRGGHGYCSANVGISLGSNYSSFLSAYCTSRSMRSRDFAMSLTPPHHAGGT